MGRILLRFFVSKIGNLIIAIALGVGLYAIPDGLSWPLLIVVAFIFGLLVAVLAELGDCARRRLRQD